MTGRRNRSRPMKLLLLSVLLCGPGAVGAPAGAPPRRTQMDAALAHFEWEDDHCRMMIDVCETGPMLRLDRIERLRCVSAGAGKATCRFVSGLERCEARFVSAVAVREYARARSWRRKLPGALPTWLLDWRTSPRPSAPWIDCSTRH
jgi:hypothetical protein